jgi:twitching motility two-component system response regulator PilH
MKTPILNGRTAAVKEARRRACDTIGVEPDMATPTVLIIDDARTSILAASLPLKAAGYRVLVAMTAREGLALAAAECPDVILMDVVMPELNGLEALRELRRASATKDIPVILATSSPERLEDEVLPQWDDCIAKPVQGDLLLAKVRRLLGD